MSLLALDLFPNFSAPFFSPICWALSHPVWVLRHLVTANATPQPQFWLTRLLCSAPRIWNTLQVTASHSLLFDTTWRLTAFSLFYFPSATQPEMRQFLRAGALWIIKFLTSSRTNTYSHEVRFGAFPWTTFCVILIYHTRLVFKRDPLTSIWQHLKLWWLSGG